MGQITRCPSCGTMFKVVPDQLRISEGWVRCGHCAEVFDARLNMQPDPAGPPVPAPALVSSLPAPAAPGKIKSAWVPVVTDSGMPSDLPLTRSDGLADVMRDVPSPVEPLQGLARDGAAADLSARQPIPQPNPPADSDDVSFLRKSRATGFWRRPLVRTGLALLTFALLVTLVFQVAIDQRDRLAAMEPRVRPWLEVACLPSACKVQALRQIESLVMDGSSFNKYAPNVYRLAFSVRNISRWDLALPALELTLTNDQDQALLRRVFKPVELGAQAGSIKAGAEWSGSALVRLSLASGDVVGYRILAFYP